MNAFQRCTPGSMDNLDIKSLLQWSMIDAECLHEARQVYKSKHGDRKVLLHLEFSAGLLPKEESGAYRPENLVTSQVLLNNFGDFIEHLQVDFPLFSGGGVSDNMIIWHINDKCSKSLKSLSLKDCKGDALNEFTNTFANLESLTFSTYSHAPFHWNKTIEEVFPNLKALLIKNTKASDWVHIHGKFPKLTKFRVDMPESQSQDSVQNAHVIDFIQNNTSIKDLEIKRSNRALLKAISLLLPRLEVLFLDYFDRNFNNIQAEIAQFNEVRELKINSKYGEMPVGTSFNKLQRIQLYSYSGMSSRWLDFINQQTNPRISELEIQAHNMQSADFSMIPQKMPYIKVAYVKCYTSISADQIATFLDRAKHLTQLRLYALIKEDGLNSLQRMLPHEWNLQIISTGGDTSEIYLEKSD